MPTPALNIPIKATGLDDFKRQMNETSQIAGTAARVVTAQVIRMNAEFLASRGAVGAATLAFGQLLGFLGPIALGINAVRDTFSFLRTSVELATQRIAEFNDVATKAASANVSTNFYQRITKAATDSGLSMDDATNALKRFDEASQSVLGGSHLEKRIKELQDAGNFTGNTGVGSFLSSTTNEQRIRALVDLIDQAMQKGERLAAIDLTQRAFGSAVANALRADAGYLDQMLKSADTIKASQIISDADIGRAIELRDRMDEAQKILAERWKPVQNDIAQLGINFKENWTSVVEVFANLVALADKLYETIKGIPDVFASIGNSSIWSKLTELTGSLGLNSTPESMGIETGINVQRLDANNRLGDALRNPANVRRAMQETTTVQTAVRGDTSRNPSTSQPTEDAVDRAIQGLSKHIEMQRADTAATGLGAAALARFRAEAAETAAVQANGGKETAEQAERFKQLQQQAAAAADALAKARVNSQISFDRQTAFLTPEDVQVANQLRNIYGNDVPAALGSSEAAAMRLNNTLRSTGEAFSNSLNDPLLDFETGAKNAGDALRSFEQQFARSLLSMANQALIIKPLLSGFGSLFGLGGATSALPLPGEGAFIGPIARADGGMIRGPGGPRDDKIPAMLSDGEFVINSASTSKHRALLEAINSDRIPRFADGGLVGSGSDAPMIGGNEMTIAPNIQVSVQGNPGMSDVDHQRMGENIGKAAMDTIRGLVAKELRTQMRPGGILR